MTKKRKLILISLAVVAVAGGIAAWVILSKPALPPGIAGGNGRLEAREVDVVAKYAGRLKTVLFDEGDTVEAGQVVATIDTEPLEAQLRAAEAQIMEAKHNLSTAQAEVKVKAAESDVAAKEYKRAKPLVSTGAISQQELDVDQAKSIIVVKRSMGHGYAGLENELYYDPKTSMYFADAKKAMAELTAAVKTLVG